MQHQRHASSIAATVVPLAAGSLVRAVLLAGMLAVLSGVPCVLAGLVRFGFCHQPSFEAGDCYNFKSRSRCAVDRVMPVGTLARLANRMERETAIAPAKASSGWLMGRGSFPGRFLSGGLKEAALLTDQDVFVTQALGSTVRSLKWACEIIPVRDVS
jgi:hypothetical protein